MAIKYKSTKNLSKKKTTGSKISNTKKHTSVLNSNIKKKTKHQLRELNKQDVDIGSIHKELKNVKPESILPKQSLTGKEFVQMSKQDTKTQKENKEKKEKVANDLVEQLELISGFQL